MKELLKIRHFKLLLSLLSTISVIFAFSTSADEYISSKQKKKDSISVLSLETAIQEAIENNALLEAAKTEEIANKARVQPSAALENPVLEASLTNYPVSGFDARQSGMTGNEIMLSQKFPFPGKRDRLKEIAVNQLESSSYEVKKTTLEVIQAVKTIYYDLFLSYKRQELINDQLKFIKGLETVAINKYSISTASQTDVLEIQLKATTLKLKLSEEKKNVSAKRAELNHFLGRTNHLSEWKPQPITETKIDLNAITRAINHEDTIKDAPKVNSLNSLLKVADSKVDYTNLNTYPDFEIGVGYMQRFANREDNGADFISAKISIDLPILQRTKQEEKQKEALAERQRAQALLKEATIQLSHDFHETIAKLIEGQEKLSLYRKAILPLANASIISSQKAYAVNEASYITVLNLINSRFEAESDYYSVLVQHESALADLESLTGSSISELLIKGK